MQLAANTALVLVDLQRAIDDPSWAAEGPRNNPQAEGNVAKLLAAWRRAGKSVFHVKHDGTFATSTYRPGQPGNEFKPEAMPLPN
jgi:nicotinamidase-related amidase